MPAECRAFLSRSCCHPCGRESSGFGKVTVLSVQPGYKQQPQGLDGPCQALCTHASKAKAVDLSWFRARQNNDIVERTLACKSSSFTAFVQRLLTNRQRAEADVVLVESGYGISEPCVDDMKAQTDIPLVDHAHSTLSISSNTSARWGANPSGRVWLRYSSLSGFLRHCFRRRVATA